MNNNVSKSIFNRNSKQTLKHFVFCAFKCTPGDADRSLPCYFILLPSLALSQHVTIHKMKAWQLSYYSIHADNLMQILCVIV